MAETAGASASAEDATVDVAENPPDPARVLRRLRADVDMCRRVAGELDAGLAAMAAKRDEVIAMYDSKLAEAEAILTAADAALYGAVQALADAEEGTV